MDFTWVVKTGSSCDGRPEVTMCSELQLGENHLTLPISGTIQSCSGTLSLVCDEEDRLFLNGYQTWTPCPEYTIHSKQRGMQGIPRSAFPRFAFDRYSDYHFVEYPYKEGKLHGFSWMYVRRGGHYRLFASLDEKPGYTIFRYDAETATLRIDRDCEGLDWKESQGEFPAFDLFYAEGSEQEVFDAWFDALNVTPRTTEPLYGYSSWYNRYQNISEETIAEDLRNCQTLFEPGDMFQIDDGWEPKVGDWLESDAAKFPRGMKAVCDDIHAAGFRAGIWLAPFAAEKDSALFQEHPDWFIQEDDRAIRYLPDLSLAQARLDNTLSESSWLRSMSPRNRVQEIEGKNTFLANNLSKVWPWKVGGKAGADASASPKGRPWKVGGDASNSPKGRPWKAGGNWSGFYGLDIDHPEVQEYLRKVFDRVFNEWGFDLVKLDFLYAGAPFGNSIETRAGRMIRIMEFLRELCGDKLILGCGVPVMPAFGLVDYCRISCDVTLDWDDVPYMRIIHRERPSTYNAIANIISRRQLNGRAYLSDPDVFFLRTDNIKLSDTQKDYLASLGALLGGVFMTSDDPGKYSDRQRSEYRRLRRMTEAEILSVEGTSVEYVFDGITYRM